MRRFITVLLVLGVHICSAQTKKVHPGSAESRKEEYALPCCYRTILDTIRAHGYKKIGDFTTKIVNSEYRIVEHDKQIRISSTTRGPITLHSTVDDIKQWNDVIDWKKVKYLYCSNATKHILVGMAPIEGPSGLSTNFDKILVVDLDTGFFCIDETLCYDPRFFYMTPHSIKFYLFDYSDDFRENKDFDHVSLNIKQYEFGSTKLSLLRTITRKCTCQEKRH